MTLTADATPVSLPFLLKWTLSTFPKNELMATWGEMSLTNDARGATSVANDSVALTQIKDWSGQGALYAVWNQHLLQEKQTRRRAHAAATDGDAAALADHLRWGTGGGGD